MFRGIALLLISLSFATGLSACTAAEPTVPADQDVAALVTPSTADAPQDDAEGTAGAAGTAGTAGPATAASASASAMPTEDDLASASIPLCADPAFRQQASSMGFLFTTLPVAGAVVSPGFTVAGCANVNEGNVQWRLLDARGGVVNDGFTQASCGTGCVGDFAFNVDYAVPDGIQPSGTLEVFSTNEADGSEMFLNAIPLMLDGSLSAASSGPMPGSTSSCDDPAFADAGASMAFIFTSTPAAGSLVRSGFEVAGCSNVFEANVQWRLEDAAGSELAAGFSQAACGTGCVGAFSFTVDYAPPADAPALATLFLFAQSMQTGAEELVNAIPLIVE